MVANLPVTTDQLAAFSRRWALRELAVFGSTARGDAASDSDVDLMVTFAADARPTLFDLIRMREELQAMFGRPVDLVTRRGIEAARNARRRDEILASAEVIHAA